MNENLLRGKRAEHSLSQEEIARQLGVSRTTYRFKESGEGDFSGSEIRKLASVLSLNLNEVNAIFFDNKLT